MTDTTTDAEAIARIIDPGAHVESPPAPYLPMDEELFALRRKTALVQANAAHALLARYRIERLDRLASSGRSAS